MDEKSQEYFASLMKKEPAALTEGDRAFLIARESYLTSDQRKAYAEIFPAKAKKKDEE